MMRRNMRRTMITRSMLESRGKDKDNVRTVREEAGEEEVTRNGKEEYQICD